MEGVVGVLLIVDVYIFIIVVPVVCCIFAFSVFSLVFGYHRNTIVRDFKNSFHVRLVEMINFLM